MVLFMDFGYILLHFSLYFGTYSIAFWCKIHCVLVHIALRFGAKCTAFWCILRCVLVQNALQQPAIRHHFPVVADANFGDFFFKEKCKNIVNGQKRRG